MKTLFKLSWLALATAALLTGPLSGAEPAANTNSLKAEIIVNRDTYELDLATSGDEFFKQATDKKRPARLPAPPKVDLVLRISNPGAADRTLTMGGDESRVVLRLDGPGTLNLSPGLATTMEFRMGQPVVVKAGAHYDLPIKSLATGHRNIGQYSYWTKAGELSLKATFTCGDGQDGSRVTLKTKLVKLKVVEPAPPPAAVPPK
ncbi:MAG: hypothetical protein EXS33_03790 [Pedosphaera sp.]|nr:hypothetical protein [Pedosphaera sp.]